VKVPVLLVWGKDDNLVPVKDADEFERLIPDARKVIFEDTGHVPMLERPSTFNDLVVEFLAESEADGRGGRELIEDASVAGAAPD
jgi:pimeloyl-ACP methyl ester carboxylesterase